MPKGLLIKLCTTTGGSKVVPGKVYIPVNVVITKNPLFVGERKTLSLHSSVVVSMERALT